MLISEVFLEATLACQTARRVSPLPQGAVVQKSLLFQQRDVMFYEC